MRLTNLMSRHEVMKMAETEKRSGTFLSAKAYDRWKFIAQIVLPALGALYFGLSEIWGLPYGAEVVGSITVIDLFLGAVLGFSSAQYYKSGANFDGTLSIAPKPDGGERVVFDVETDPETVIKQFGKKSFEFRVDRPKS